MANPVAATLDMLTLFGPAIAALYRADPHRPGSVDAVLIERMRPLTPASRAALYPAQAEAPRYRPGARPELERWVRQATVDAIHPVQVAVALTRFCARIPTLFPTPERSTAAGFYGDFRSYLCGGTEEEVIKKGSPLAAERARVLCALAQVAGLPARIAFLARPDPPERHTVTEIFLYTKWSVFDGFSGRFYPWPKHYYASVPEIQAIPGMVDQAADHGRDRYVDSAYFRHVAVAEYPIEDFGHYAYPWDPIPEDLAERLRAGLGA